MGIGEDVPGHSSGTPPCLAVCWGPSLVLKQGKGRVMHPPTPDPEFNHNSQGGAMWENVSRTVAFLDLSNSSDLPKSPRSARVSVSSYFLTEVFNFTLGFQGDVLLYVVVLRKLFPRHHFKS